MFGDPVTSGERVDNRPKCGYKVEKTIKGADGTDIQRTLPCGSEEGLMNVEGRGKSGYPKKTPVCSKHRLDAWRNWNVDRIDPL
jgi:hypothetical protein